MELDTNPFDQDRVELLKSGVCHVVTFAETGFSAFKACCDFAYNIPWVEIQKYADQVNNANETGSLYPKGNITALPLHFFREPITNSIPGYSEDDLKICIRDAFIVERDYIKSGLMILEFTCSDISYELVYTICRDLCKTEFESVPGRAVLRHNHMLKNNS